MQIVSPSSQMPISYQAGNQNPFLFVRAKVYDVSTGSAVFLTNVNLVETVNGLYCGSYPSTSTKSYLTIAVVYTNGTYSTIDLGWGPAAQCYRTQDAPLNTFLLNYGTYDQSTSLYVGASIFDVTTGSAVFKSFFSMNQVFAGVYFGSYAGISLSSYVATTSVYTDGTYAVVDSSRPSGSDIIEMTVASTTNTVINITTPLTLIGQNLTAILEASC